MSTNDYVEYEIYVDDEYAAGVSGSEAEATKEMLHYVKCNMRMMVK